MISDPKMRACMKQAAYRRRIKQQGGFYVGVMLKGDAAKLLKDAKERSGKTYSDLITDAVLLSLRTGQTPPARSLEQQSWDELKVHEKDYNWDALA